MNLSVLQFYQLVLRSSTKTKSLNSNIHKRRRTKFLQQNDKPFSNSHAFQETNLFSFAKATEYDAQQPDKLWGLGCRFFQITKIGLKKYLSVMYLQMFILQTQFKSKYKFWRKKMI